MRTRLALLAAVVAALFPTAAQAAEDACLPAKGAVADQSIRGVRVGVKANIRDHEGKRLDVSSVSYCVQGGGEFGFALTQVADVVLVLSNAEGDAIGAINPTSPAQSARAEFPKMRRLTRTGETAVYRVDRKRQLLLGVAAGRVNFVAAADRLLLEHPSKLRYYLRRLGY